MAQQTYSDLGFTVTPEALYTKSEQVKSSIDGMKNEFDSIKAILNKTSSYWIGEAGDTYRQRYKDKEENIQEIFTRLSSHVTNLNQIASQYVEVENKTQELAQTLPGDVIV